MNMIFSFYQVLGNKKTPPSGAEEGRRNKLFIFQLSTLVSLDKTPSHWYSTPAYYERKRSAGMEVVRLNTLNSLPITIFMTQYELLCVLPGTLSEEEVGPMVAQVQAVLTENGATDIQAVDMGKSRLTYPMRHIRYGYFRTFYFAAEPESVQKMQNKLRLMRELLRALITVDHPEKRAEYAEKKAAGQRRSAAHKQAKEKAAAPAKKEEAPKAAAPAKEEKKESASAKATADEGEVKTETPETKETAKPAVDMQEIDKKLDALLESDMEKV